MFPYHWDLQQESPPLVSSTSCFLPSQEPLTGYSVTLTRAERLAVICIHTNRLWLNKMVQHKLVHIWQKLCRSDCAAFHMFSRCWKNHVLRPDWNKCRLHQRKPNLFLPEDSLSTQENINSSVWVVFSIYRALAHVLGSKCGTLQLFSGNFRLQS